MTIARPHTARVLLASGLAAALLLSLLVTADASSHREAPLIAEDPVADNTDVYAFVSPDDPDTVTLISNWIPFENPAGGPNFYNFGEDVLYEINIDNDGDAVDDVKFEFSFTTNIRNPDTFLYATGPIESLDDEDFNLYQTYTVAVVKDGQRRVLGTDLPVPPNNVGPRSTPDYPALAEAAIMELPESITVFAGQRDEAFAVDLGSIFDLGGLRPFNEAHLIPLPEADGVNTTDGFNVHSIALKVPTSYLVESEDEPIIGVYSTTYRHKVRVFADNNGAMPMATGPFIQISRLGNPLVNEVVIPLGLKDAFNSLAPRDDVATLSTEDGSIPLVQDPELAQLLPVLYPGVVEVPPTPRDDLVAIFLTGIVLPEGTNGCSGDACNLNNNTTFGDSGGGQPSEMLRLNTAVPPTGTDPNEQNPLGLLGGEADGHPNGRRLNDDVVDIALRAVAGATPFTPEFDVAPNNQLADGARGNDLPYLTSFPYIPHPHSGYDVPSGE